MITTLLIITFIIGFIIIRLSRMAKNGQNKTSLNNQRKNSDSQLKFIDIDHQLPRRNFALCPLELNGGGGQVGKTTTTKKLVIIFGWLFAQDRHLDKYRKLYLDLGFDVLTIRTDLIQLLFPTFGSQIMMLKLIEFIRKNQNQYNQYIVHAFSVGVYVMGESLVLMKQNRNKDVRDILRKQWKGVIIDSAVDVNEGPIGLAKATTTNFLLQILIIILIRFYYIINYPLATRHYLESSRQIHINPYNCPSLAFISKDDPMVNHDDHIKTFEKHRNNGLIAIVKSWNQSQHVAHYLKYPDEYRSILIKFLDNVM
uniref:Transmembrane protein 53-A-like n=1 Tax=Dermatophagoides pteronyssinus TaxID=6956 RepID=A0A6P6XR44_DERPT|nr:transmembrane protein 53-A-like [Dermatophagoides pteronyssinus]